MKVISIDIHQLKPGMVLAQDLRDNLTGIVLLSSGSKITEKTLRAIEQFNVQSRCLIYSEDKNRVYTENPQKKIRQEKYTKTLIKQ